MGNCMFETKPATGTTKPDRPRLTLRLEGSTPPPVPEPTPPEPPAAAPESPATAPATAKKRKRRVFDLTEAEIAERVATLARVREMFPAVFGDDPKPLAIRTGARLREALGVSDQAIGTMMLWWVTRPSYTRAVAAQGSQRWNLDGTVAGDVSDEHRKDASDALANSAGKPKSQQQEGPTVMTATVQAKSIKATVVLETSDIVQLKVPNGVSRVLLRVEVAGRALTADVNAKSVRKCIAAIEAAGSDVANVVLQGRLEGDTLVEAGIAATSMTPKPAADEAAEPHDQV
jgi:hypothetical protein